MIPARALTLSFIAFSVSMGGGTAIAGIIYDNGDSLHTSAGYSNSGFGQWLADDFVLEDGATTITDIHWWGGYFPGDAVSDAFTIYIFDDLDNAAIYTLDGAATGRADSGSNLSAFGIDEYEYWLYIDPLTLQANTTYWISIANTASNWLWSFASTTSGDLYRSTDGPDGPWSHPTANLEAAFYLTNDTVIPEPATLTLLGLGLAALGLRRRRARAK